jgi:hypothetical protein
LQQSLGHRIRSYHVQYDARQGTPPGPEDIRPERHFCVSEGIVEQIEWKNRHQSGQSDDDGAMLFGQAVEFLKFVTLGKPINHCVPGKITENQKSQTGTHGGPILK